MKCKNCGGNYSLRDAQCPYCGTPSALGALWKNRKDSAEEHYRATETQVRKKLPLEVADRVSNWALVILIIMLVLSIVISMIYIGVEANGGLFKESERNQKTHMENLYNEGRFSELDAYMDKNNIDRREYADYTLMCLLEWHYNEMNQAKAELLRKIENGNPLVDEYFLWNITYMLNETSKIVTMDLTSYPELGEKNLALYADCCLEAETACRVFLGLTEQETAALSGRGYHFISNGYIEPNSERDSDWGEPVYINENHQLIQEIVSREAWK